MTLTFPGGVILPQQSDTSAFTENILASSIGEVYLRVEREEDVEKRSGDPVTVGERVAVCEDGTPIYSSVSGYYDGLFSVNGGLYAKVSADPDPNKTPVRARAPEQKALTELTSEELIEALKVLSVRDGYRGGFLWRRCAQYAGSVRRVVVDLTDDSGWSFTNYRTTLREPGAILSGAKILLHLLGATKIILVTDRKRTKIKHAFRALINDPALTVVAEMETKYPVREQTLYSALYATSIPLGKTADDLGVFIVKGQTAAEVFHGMTTGMAQLSRRMTLSGVGFARPGVYEVPIGMSWDRLLSGAGFKGSPFTVRKDSPLSGALVDGIPDDTTEVAIAALERRRKPTKCISCGNCVRVCPMHLQPFRFLSGNEKTLRELRLTCLKCGCCSYVCPSRISLYELGEEKEKTVGELNEKES